ncbi:WD40 repeat domain-containing protein [Micromonospora olivasterospora]|uniref:WD40 repeat domain-containing protein n=1 Tax=Micromonospora olivasterospora TaxID=1880 RepID=UPI001478DC25|nr:WD40 repeat domain-containing protein [Micromonospora olivasterospora]
MADGPGRRMLASASEDRTVRLWPLPDGAAGLAGLPAVPGGGLPLETTPHLCPGPALV